MSHFLYLYILYVLILFGNKAGVVVVRIINTVNMWATFYSILRIEKYICNTFSAIIA